MKALFLITTIWASLGFAGNIEPGLYSAVDVETKSIIATLAVRADMTANLILKAPDFTMPEPGCEGTYAVANNILTADMKCPVQGLEKVHVTMNVADVTAESVRSPQGVIVDVVIDALGNESYKFVLKKIK